MLVIDTVFTIHDSLVLLSYGIDRIGELGSRNGSDAYFSGHRGLYLGRVVSGHEYICQTLLSLFSIILKCYYETK